MSTGIKPIMYKAQEYPGFLDTLAQDIRSTESDADLMLDYPSVYIHVWRSRDDILNGTWSVYVGETNDIVARTKEHWAAARVPQDRRDVGNWQYHLIEDVDEIDSQVVPTLYIFGHKLFHKSLTLDIENRLIDYCLAMDTAHLYNGRGNTQGCYSGDNNLDAVFSMIWRYLKTDNPELFLPETSIKKSAIFKASPNHQLTADQKKAKQLIIDRTVDAVLNEKTGQLIFVEGEAGTGKTVLTSSSFFEIMENELLTSLNLSCFLLINHNEQRAVYENMARKLGYSDEMIQTPTSFLNNHSKMNSSQDEYLPDESKIVDLVFVDEAHLLWNQNNQGFDSRFKESQLDEIMKRARVTVIMFDENQIVHKGQIPTLNFMQNKRECARGQGPNPEAGETNYIQIVNQLRMNCSGGTMNWVDAFSKSLEVNELILKRGFKDDKGYEVKAFDSPGDLQKAIKVKASKKETQLSRIIATFDWEYNNNKPAPAEQRYWQVQIGDWFIPWHEQIFHVDMKDSLNRRERYRYDALNWAEKDYSINEVGSLFTIQGFDLAYAGVILGPSVRYDKTTKKIYFNEDCRALNYMRGNRTMSDGSVVNVTDTISQHELRVLMTRGTRGLYIYACDDNLREVLRQAIKRE